VCGGPGVSCEYLDELAGERGAGFQVAAYQQRGIEPSTLEGPFAVERSPTRSRFSTARPGRGAGVIEGAGHVPWFERPGCVRTGASAEPHAAAREGGAGCPRRAPVGESPRRRQHGRY